MLGFLTSSIPLAVISRFQIKSSAPMEDRTNRRGIAYMGHYKSGKPAGKFWLGMIGDGFLHGDTRTDGKKNQAKL